MTSRARVRPAAAALFAACLGAVGVAEAQVVESARVHVVHVGASATGSERGGPSRSGLVDAPLPAAPVPTWRRALAAPLETTPVVARDGRVAVILSGSGDVRIFDGAEGHDLGSIDVGGPAASVAPAFLGDGTLVVLGATGTATFIDRWGSVVARVPLGIRGPDAIAPTATPRGTVAIAVGRQIVEIDPKGKVLARGFLDDDIHAPLAIASSTSGGHEIVATTARGDVWLARGVVAPTRLGTLGVSPGGAAVARDGALWAVALGGASRMERRGKLMPWRANAASGVLAGRGPPALGADGSVAFVGIDGSLVVLEPSGDVRFRVALDRAALAATPTGPGGSPSRPTGDDGPPLLIDATGRVAFARSSGRVGVVMADGRVAVASERLCASPLGIAKSPGGFVVGCGEGYLIGIGEAAE